MRRTLFALLFTLTIFHLKAQETKIVSITTKDRIFSGTIDDSYPITMYLKVVAHSENSGYVQSLTGWYSYDNIRTPIPLAGLIGQGLHLVSSNDQQVLDGILDFEYESTEGTISLDGRIFDIADNMAKVKNITERFEINYEGNLVIGTWYGNNKALKVELHNKEYRVSETVNYLKLANGNLFALDYLGLPGRTLFEIEASPNNGRNILLDYGFYANLNYMGQCGAAENRGKIALAFNENYDLVSSSYTVFEDCYRSIYTYNENKISEFVTEYVIEDFNDSENSLYETYLVDYERATITKKSGG